MASSFTSGLALENPTPFDPAVRNLWGTIENTGRSLVDSAIVGQVALSVAGSSDLILTSAQGAPDQSRFAHYTFSGLLTGNIKVLWPQFARIFSVFNNTTGAFTLTVGVNDGGGGFAGTNVSVPQGRKVFLISDGANVVPRFDSVNLTGSTLTDVTLSGTTTLPGSGRISSSGYIGIGMTPTNPLDITANQNALSGAVILNNDGGAAAATEFRAHNGTSQGEFGHFGTGFTTSGIQRQSGTFLFGSGAGGLTVATTVNQPLYFGVNNTEVGRWTAAGLGIGMTPTNIFDITQTQDSFSIGKILNASAGTAARAGWQASNGTSTTTIFQHGTGFTTSGVDRQSGGIVSSAGPGGLTMHASDASGVLYFGVNNVEVGRISGSGNTTVTHQVANADTGNAALAEFAASNGLHSIRLRQYGANHATAPDISELAASGTGGMTIGTDGNNITFKTSSGVTRLALGATNTFPAGDNLHILGQLVLGAAQAVNGGSDLVVTNTRAVMGNTTNWTGVTGGSDGRVIIVRGPTAGSADILHQSASSAAANRFDLPGNNNITLDQDASAVFMYDGVQSRWLLLSFSG